MAMTVGEADGGRGSCSGCGKGGRGADMAFRRSLARLEEFREEILRLHEGEVATLRQENVLLQLKIEQDTQQIQGLQAELKKVQAPPELGPIKFVKSRNSSAASACSLSCGGVGGEQVADAAAAAPRTGEGDRAADRVAEVAAAADTGNTEKEVVATPEVAGVARNGSGDFAGGPVSSAADSAGAAASGLPGNDGEGEEVVEAAVEITVSATPGAASSSSSGNAAAGAASCETSAAPSKLDDPAVDARASASVEPSVCHEASSSRDGKRVKKSKSKRSVEPEESPGGVHQREMGQRVLANRQNSTSTDMSEAFGMDDLQCVRRSVTSPERPMGDSAPLPGIPQGSSYRPIVPADPGTGRCQGSCETGVTRSSVGGAPPLGVEFASTASRCSSKESHYNPNVAAAAEAGVIESEPRFQVLGFWAHEEVVLRPITQSWESVCQVTRHGSCKSDSILPLDEGFSSWVVHPFSWKRLLWDLLCLIFVAADVVFVPLHFFDLPQNTFTTFASWSSRIFWIFDMVASLFTGTYIKGILEMRPSKVAHRYASTWLFPDTLILLAQWVQAFFEQTMNQSKMWPVMIILRGARVVRLLRLLQLLKVQVVLHEIGTKFNSNTNFAMVGFVKFIMCSVVSIHFSACIWYGIGWSRTDGWVYIERLESAGVVRSYMTSLHWTLAQIHGDSSFHPGNLQEYAFANAFMLLGLIVFCYLVGAITNMMMQMELMRSNDMRQQRLLCGYLKRHGISSALSIRARVHFESTSKQKQEEQLEEDQTKAVLAFLPQSLQLDIAEEIHGPIMTTYSFLSDVKEENPRIVRHLCHEALEEVSVQAGEVVFSAGDVCRRMLFIMSGTASYTLLRRPSSPRMKLHHQASSNVSMNPMPVGFHSVKVIEEKDSEQEDDFKTFSREAEEDSNGSHTLNSVGKHLKRMRSRSPSDGNVSSIPLNTGDFVSEAALWTTWEYCGEFAALNQLTMLALDSTNFASVIARNISAYSYAVRYARIFVKRLNNHAECSDVLRFHLVKSAVENEPFEYRTLADDAMGRSSSKTMASLKRSLRRLEPLSADATSHFMFISHHKAEAGTEAALMQEALERMISEDARSSGNLMKAPVFLDSEDLSDLSQLKEHVRKSRNLVVLLTKEVLERPWVLVEIVTASQHGLNIVPVEVQKKDMSFDYPDEVFFSKILDGTALTEDATRLLLNEGIHLDELEKTLRKVFKKIAVPFSPHKSANVRDAELRDILRRCQDAAVDLA